jgi:hypothetical protein
MHERTGQAAEHRAAAERARERDVLRQQYEESSRADQERDKAEAEAAQRAETEEEVRKQAEEAKAAAVREAECRARESALAREVRRREAADRLNPEPQAGAPRTATLRLVLPSGTSVLRRFARDAPMSQVFLWAASLEEVAGLGGEDGGAGENTGGEGEDRDHYAEWELIPPPGIGIEGQLFPSGESVEEMRLAPDSTLRLRMAL